MNPFDPHKHSVSQSQEIQNVASPSSTRADISAYRHPIAETPPPTKGERSIFDRFAYGLGGGLMGLCLGPLVAVANFIGAIVGLKSEKNKKDTYVWNLTKAVGILIASPFLFCGLGVLYGAGILKDDEDGGSQ